MRDRSKWLPLWNDSTRHLKLFSFENISETPWIHFKIFWNYANHIEITTPTAGNKIRVIMLLALVVRVRLMEYINDIFFVFLWMMFPCPVQRESSENILNSLLQYYIHMILGGSIMISLPVKYSYVIFHFKTLSRKRMKIHIFKYILVVHGH